MRQFVGIDLGCEPAPDETTVCKFRHLLEEHQLGEQILGQVNLHLQAQGVRITTGTIVDATILHAPTSTKNREQQRDPEMHQTKKGRQYHACSGSADGCSPGPAARTPGSLRSVRDKPDRPTPAFLRRAIDRAAPPNRRRWPPSPPPCG